MIEHHYETTDGRTHEFRYDMTHPNPHATRNATAFDRLCAAGHEPDFRWFDIVCHYPPHTITGYAVDCDSDTFWRAMAEA